MSGTTKTALRPSEPDAERGDRGPETPWDNPEVEKDDDREEDRTQVAEPDPNPGTPISKDPEERQPWPQPKVHKDDPKEDEPNNGATQEPTVDPVGKDPD